MRQMQFIISWLAIASLGCAAPSAADAHARTAVQRDVEGYAVASCLAAQGQAEIKDQGDGWASAIIHRGKGELDAFTAVATAVKTEVAKGNMAVVHNESDPMHGKSMPVMYCSEIIDVPSVRSTIEKAVKALAPSYK
jgi:hypothetical protein